MSRTREVVEGLIDQGEDESVVFSIDVSNWGAGPTGVSVVAKDSGGNDVSGTVLTGTASVNANVITLPALHSLSKGTEYRVEVKFTLGSSDLECYFRVLAEE